MISTSADIAPTKTHRDENFPVASRLIHPRHRGPILAFYRYVRAADDIADHPALAEAEKLSRLDRLEAGLLGRGEATPEAAALRTVLAARGLSPRHAQDLVTAFRLDVTKRRYDDWDDLIRYCSFSAMPVGRFVLDVHGEDRRLWPANDALCAALQVINHLQDCAADFRNLDRVYLPRDALARHGETVNALAAPRASAGLRACIVELAERTGRLLDESEPFAARIADTRLALEVGTIQRIARALVRTLKARDPLCERVHMSKARFLSVGAAGALGEAVRRLGRRLTGAARRGTQGA